MPSPEKPSSESPRLIVLVGPTAVGKTEVSLQLAESLKTEIISADSRLLYTGMDIGTAKPSLEERKRIPHHLIDVTTPDKPWSLPVFQQAAHEAILDINSRGFVPMLVGGTGQYIRAILAGWQAPVVPPNPALRAAFHQLADQNGPQALHEKLAMLDPEAALGIDYRNVRRTVRALEVIFSTGQRFSAQRRSIASPYNTLTLGITRPRAELYARIDARIKAMFEQGLIEEVRSLLAQGYDPELPAFSAIGYREVIAYIQRDISLEEATLRIQRQSRVFVRRQANWFKPDDPTIHWFEADKDLVAQMLEMIYHWLEII